MNPSLMEDLQETVSEIVDLQENDEKSKNDHEEKQRPAENKLEVDEAHEILQTDDHHATLDGETELKSNPMGDSQGSKSKWQPLPANPPESNKGNCESTRNQEVQEKQEDSPANGHQSNEESCESNQHTMENEQDDLQSDKRQLNGCVEAEQSTSVAVSTLSESAARREPILCDLDTDSDTESDSSTSSLTSFSSLENVSTTKLKVIKPVKTKGELGIEDLPPVEKLTISVPENHMQEIGKVYCILDQLVVVESFQNSPPLDCDSVLFLSHAKPLGNIFEVFGPVKQPYYLIRFNTNEEIAENGIAKDDSVFYAPSHSDITTFIFTEVLMREKGSDASWEHNNEPPEEHLDFSDDEKERAARRKRAAKNHRPTMAADAVTPKRSNMSNENQNGVHPEVAERHYRQYKRSEITVGNSSRRILKSPAVLKFQEHHQSANQNMTTAEFRVQRNFSFSQARFPPPHQTPLQHSPVVPSPPVIYPANQPSPGHFAFGIMNNQRVPGPDVFRSHLSPQKVPFSSRITCPPSSPFPPPVLQKPPPTPFIQRPVPPSPLPLPLVAATADQYVPGHANSFIRAPGVDHSFGQNSRIPGNFTFGSPRLPEPQQATVQQNPFSSPPVAMNRQSSAPVFRFGQTTNHGFHGPDSFKTSSNHQVMTPLTSISQHSGPTALANSSSVQQNFAGHANSFCQPHQTGFQSNPIHQQPSTPVFAFGGTDSLKFQGPVNFETGNSPQQSQPVNGIPCAPGTGLFMSSPQTPSVPIPQQPGPPLLITGSSTDRKFTGHPNYFPEPQHFVQSRPVPAPPVSQPPSVPVFSFGQTTNHSIQNLGLASSSQFASRNPCAPSIGSFSHSVCERTPLAVQYSRPPPLTATNATEQRFASHINSFSQPQVTHPQQSVFQPRPLTVPSVTSAVGQQSPSPVFSFGQRFQAHESFGTIRSPQGFHFANSNPAAPSGSFPPPPFPRASAPHLQQLVPPPPLITNSSNDQKLHGY